MLEMGLKYYIEEQLKIDTRKNVSYTNQVYVTGKLKDDFQFSYQIKDEKFYTNTIIMTRFSNELDEIPILVSDRSINNINVTKKCEGLKVAIVGIYRSYSKKNENGESHMKTNIIGRYVTVIPDNHENSVDENNIYLEGYVCRPTTFRKTTKRRRITDIFIAVNRPHGKRDFIPCICWAEKALLASGLQVGDKIRLIGRMQKRKETIPGTEEEKIHYEISASDFEKVE